MEAFIRCYPPQLPSANTHVWYVMRGDDFVVDVHASTEPLAGDAHGPHSIAITQHFPLGQQGQIAVHAAVVAADCELSEGLQTVNLRTMMNLKLIQMIRYHLLEHFLNWVDFMRTI